MPTLRKSVPPLKLDSRSVPYPPTLAFLDDALVLPMSASLCQYYRYAYDLNKSEHK